MRPSLSRPRLKVLCEYHQKTHPYIAAALSPKRRQCIPSSFEYQVGMRADNVAGQFGIVLGLPLSGVTFYAKVLALNVAKAVQLLKKLGKSFADF
jgi:hypothetical protein